MAPSKAAKKKLNEEKEAKEARKGELEKLIAKGVPSQIAMQKYVTELAEIKERLPAIDKELGVRVPETGGGHVKIGGPQESPTTGDWTEGEVVEQKEEARPKTSKEVGTECLEDRVKLFEHSLANGMEKMPLPNVKANTAGKTCDLKANYFLLDPGKDQTLHRYSVKILEKTTSARMRRRILYLLLKQHESAMDKAATDYHQTLFSMVTLQNHPASQYYVVDYYGEGETKGREGPQKKLYTVILVHQKCFPVKDLLTFLQNSSDPSLPNGFSAEEYVSAFNIILARKPNQNPNVQHAGSSLFFDTRTGLTGRTDLGRGLEAYIGFVRSVRASQGQLLVNVNAKGSAFYKHLRMDWLIHAWSGGSETKESNDRNMLERFIKGIRVQATYGNNRVYTVFGFAPWENERPTSAISYYWHKVKDQNKKETGEIKKVFIKDYFAITYPKSHTYFRGLVINCGSARDEILIPSDCLTVLEGNRYRRLLEGDQAELMLDLAGVNPAENKRRIMEDGRPMFGINQTQDLDSPSIRFGLSLSPELLSVQGHTLKAPNLVSGDATQHTPIDGAWALNKQKKFAKQCSSGTWSYVDFTGARKNYVRELDKGVKVWCPNLKQKGAPYGGGFPEGNAKELEQILQPFKDDKIDVLFIALPSTNVADYELLKYVAEVVVGIHTVCTFKCNLIVIPSLMAKCNLKLLGDNWVLSKDNRNEVSNFLSSTTMVVGADVTHPSPGSMDDVDSVAAVVASEDNGFNRYPASLRCQASKMEMIDQFDAMLEERLEHWKGMNGNTKYPTNIVIYRDGVSESQFEKVLELEYPQICHVIKKLYGTNKQDDPGVMMLSVQKRHHTRFYPEGKTDKDKDKGGNPWPGLLVDRDVTYADKYNWFLQSHKNLLGTARPAHYVVLANTINADVEEVHKATYWQCHLYGRCMKSISIHPAARLADRACGRARAYLREYYVAGNTCNEKFDRNGRHHDAWHPTKDLTSTDQAIVKRRAATEKIKNSMFYI